MHDVEVLIKLIIPAILLIFWALSNLFNRENTQAQTQAKPGGSALGPRPGLPPQARASERERSANGQAPPRYVPPTNEDILIIRAEPTRQPGRQAQQPRRNAGRSRNAQNAQGRRTVEPPAPRQREQIGGRLVTDVNQSIAPSLDLRPLTQSMADASAATSIGTQTAASSVREGIQPTMSALDLRANLTDPSRIRQAFLLNELLQPPVALRGRTARRH